MGDVVTLVEKAEEAIKAEEAEEMTRKMMTGGSSFLSFFLFLLTRGICWGGHQGGGGRGAGTQLAPVGGFGAIISDVRVWGLD